MKDMKKGVVVAVVLLLSCILGFTSLYTPQVKDEAHTGFSAERAAKDIEVIAKEPHTVNDPEALREVREYLIKRLGELGLESEVFTYEDITDKYGWTYDINNIYTKIDGKDGEDGTYIMLVAHYDSSPAKRLGEAGGSKGAADDGYGLATILEVVRAIKESGKPLENGIKILITDAEETGLIGAEKEMTMNKALYENVSFVINLEARGIKGPAIMFETSNQNLEVIKLFKAANLPVSYSLAADVYRKMPNGTDFTHFINNGLAGINIAVLDNLDYYHTPEDNYDNISLTSLQHYGEQVLPIVETFIYDGTYGDKDALKADENGIFFTLLPNVMFLYSHTVGVVLAVVAGVLLLGTIFFAMRATQMKVMQVVKWLGAWLGIAVVMAALGFGITKLISIVCDMPLKLTYMPKVPGANWIVLGAVAVGALLVSLLLLWRVKKGASLEAIVLGGQVLQMVLLIVFMVVLSGGSFLFLWPLILTCIGMLGMIKGYRWMMLLPAGVTTMMFVPIIYVLNIALTIGALVVMMLLASFAMATIIPTVLIYMKNK
ncbi:MAG: M20/M25/M40 family metallo-hydrolase [Cellulosilyticaceae bacterium]